MRTQRGFSLVEVLTVGAMISLLLVAGVSNLRQAMAREEVDGWARSVANELAAAQQAAITRRTTVIATFQNQTFVVAAGGTIILESNARVTRDLAAAGGNVTLQGTVGRDAHLAGGRVEIAGSVAGNVLARADEVVVLPSAVIRGNLTYSSQKPAQIAPGARVIGRILQEPYLVRPMPSREIVRGFRIAFGVADFFWMLIIAMVLAAVAPGGLQQTADALHRRPWASLGWGAFLLITVPIAIVALVVMLIGIPLGVLLLVAHTLALFVSHASAGLAIGQTLAPRLKSRYAEVAIGVGVIAIATNLPYVGWLLRLIAVAVGLGAVVLALWGQREQSPPPARPIPVGPAVA